MASADVQMLISSSDPAESQPNDFQNTIPQNPVPQSTSRKRRCSVLHVPYRSFNVSQQAGIFMIVLNAFFLVSLTACFFSAAIQPINIRSLWLSIPSGFAFLLCPILGLLSECYFGKIKFLQASIYSLLFAIVLNAFIIIIPIQINIWYLTLVPLYFSAACYASCIIPLTMDQLIGASGEELSFVVYWLFWPLSIVFWTHHLVNCYLPDNVQILHATLFGVASLSFAVVFSLFQCSNGVLATNSRLSNPLKLVVRVLNYARKHVFPERRSAFTYWEEECPSRIDLGKSKYGGPFTFEEVEDVKTVLKLIPLISCSIPLISLGINNKINEDMVFCDLSDLRFWADFVSCLLIIFSLPAYQFLVYPFLYNCIPRMLRRIGFGFFAIVFSQALFSVAEVYIIAQSHDGNGNTTLTCSTFENRNFLLTSWLVLVADILRRLGSMVSTYSLLEFAVAQTPCQMRGVVTSFCMGLWGALALPQFILVHILNELCVIYVTLSLISVGVFALFVFVSKRYKLRVRNDIIPYHMFAEDQFESNYKQETDYLKRIGWLY